MYNEAAPIRAIETRYKGYRFRSRTEARWAVFLDSLGLEWAYEPEGYQTRHGQYLPDFFVEGGNGNRGPWIEVKGGTPTALEVQKLCDVCEDTASYGILVSGPPSLESPHEACKTRWLHIHKEGFPDDEDTVNPIWDQWWVTHGWERRFGAARDTDEIVAIWNGAAEHARSARFEHGEKPILPFWVDCPPLTY